MLFHEHTEFAVSTDRQYDNKTIIQADPKETSDFCLVLHSDYTPSMFNIIFHCDGLTD